MVMVGGGEVVAMVLVNGVTTAFFLSIGFTGFTDITYSCYRLAKMHIWLLLLLLLFPLTSKTLFCSH